MKINQLRKQRILALIVAMTLLSTSFGYGPAVSADESDTPEQVQSAESTDVSSENPNEDTVDDENDASPPDTEANTEESSVSGTSQDVEDEPQLLDESVDEDTENGDAQDENMSDEEANDDTDEEGLEEEEVVEETVEDTSENTSDNTDATTSEDSTTGTTSEDSATAEENLEGNVELLEVERDLKTYGFLSVDVEANNSDGPLIIEYGETYIYSWETTGADSCIKTSPVEDLNLWVSGVSSPITPADTLFYPTATSSVTITIECTNGHSTTSDSVVISLDPHMEDDDTPPIFILMPTVFAEATTSAGVMVNYTLPLAVDNEDDDVEVTCTPVSGSLFELGTTTVTCTATDDAGNTTTAIFYVVVTLDDDDPTDNTPPVIAPHGDVYATATTSAGVIVHYELPEAIDDTDYNVDVECTPMSGSLFPIGKTVVTCTATDDAGNTATSTFRVKVILDDDNGDHDKKVFVDVEANGSDGPLMLMNDETYVYAWTSKNADTCKLTSPGWFFVGLNGTSSVIAEGDDFYPTATSSVTITIKCWNEHKEASDSVVVSLATTTPPVDMPPVFGPVEDIHATTSTSTGINVDYPLPTATDDVTASSSLVVMCSPVSGSLFPVGTTTVNCSVEDEAENTATTSFNVIVTLVDDDDGGNGTTTPPIIEVGGLSCAATTTVTVTGTAATGTTVTLVGSTGTFMATTSAAGTWSAIVNLSGATSSNPFSITIFDAQGGVVATTSVDVIFDNVSPVITLNGESTMTVIVGNQFTDPGASVTDNLDASTTVSATGTVDTATLGTYTITYTAEDCAGNIATTSRTVIVEDDSGSGGGGSRRRSSNDDDDDDDDNGSVIAGNVSGFGGIGGIGGGTGFLPIPISSFIPGFMPTALAFVPGIPNTGVGGDAGRNLAMLMTALGVASLGFTLIRKPKELV